MQTSILNSELSETVKSIKRENSDDAIGGGVSTTMALDCVVCGDRATGKHYGAISCDGCKGFFRRSVRKNPVYECRHQNNCTIDKDKRNQCRHCRWKKCIRMGMRKDAVQKERDRLGRQRYHHDCTYRLATVKSIEHFHGDVEDDDEDDLSITALLRAEQTAREYIGRQIQLDQYPSNTERVQATLETIAISMNYQLRSLIEWAKDLKGFTELSDNDKIALLRGHTGENLVLGVACRSLKCDDYLLLGNHYVIPRNTLDPGLTRAAARILDEIVKPLKEIQLDEKEYACLKAIVFFDQDNKSLAEPMRVKELRKRIQVNLENYINQEKPLMRGRFGELLLLMPPLQNIARLMVDLVARYSEDTKQVDDLINEMLLNRYRDDYQDSFLLTTSFSSSSTMTRSSSSSSSSTSIAKENDLDSNGSSLDTDIEDTTSQSQDSSTTPKANSILFLPQHNSDEIHNLSLSEHDDYLSNIHFYHHTDPILNHHGQVLQYFTDTSNDRLKYIKRSKAILTPPSSTATTLNYETNNEMNFLYDLVTPTNRQFDMAQINSLNNNNNNTTLYQTDWNGRILYSTSNDIKHEHQQQNHL